MTDKRDFNDSVCLAPPGSRRIRCRPQHSPTAVEGRPCASGGPRSRPQGWGSRSRSPPVARTSPPRRLRRRAPRPTGGVKVGVILPETETSARWEGFDKPLLDRGDAGRGPRRRHPERPGRRAEVLHAGRRHDRQRASRCWSSPRSTASPGPRSPPKAKAQGIPVIDYDRLNLGGTSDYYVSFDNVKVGELQGQGLVQGARRPSRARRSSRSRARRPTTTPRCSTTASRTS